MRKRDIIQWVLGGFFFLAVFLYADDGIAAALGGLSWTVAGLFIIPYTRSILAKPIKKKLGDSSRVSSVFVVGIVLVLIAGGSAGIPESSNAENATLETNTTPTPPTPVTETPTAKSTAVTAAPEPTPTTTSTATPAPATETPAPDDTPQTAWTVTIVEVVDGDTIDIRYQNGTTDTVRLLGVDTPETSSGRTDPAEWSGIPDNSDGRSHLEDWGGQATTFAKGQLGNQIYIETDETADRRGYFGRLLVYAYSSESSTRSLNHRLISEGYARMYDSTFSKRDQFDDAESNAITAGYGVWDYEAPSDTTSSNNIEIETIHEDAQGSEYDNLDDEYVTLRNGGDRDVDMDGYTLEDDDSHVYTFEDFTLDAGASVTVYTGSGTDTDSELFWGLDSPVWNNGGDTVYVRDTSGGVVVKQSYD